MSRPGLALVVLVVMWSPGAAVASRASTGVGPDGTYTVVTYKAASGEANRLRVTGGGGWVVFDDPGASAIAAGAGCTSTSARRVVCRARGQLPDVFVTLGDGDDHASVDAHDDDGGSPAFEVAFAGGAGDDVLRSADTFTDFSGGPGNDTIVPGEFDNEIVCGAGADRVVRPRGYENIGRDCEAFSWAPATLRFVRTHAGVRVRVDAAKSVCSVDVRLYDGDGRRVAAGVVVRGQRAATLRTTETGRAFLQEPHALAIITARATTCGDTRAHRFTTFRLEV
jgi:hypothetical protein